ncbi:TRAP transporter small permease [Oscillibacter sp. GMB15532]|uniref:TRAP transporter small permease n=1 Tax=Oscillibacter sp. GMB15532 TaxID=3230022 RepID=UPI0034DE49EA
MNAIKRTQRGIARVSLAIAAAFLGTVALAIFLSVVCRHVLQIGIMWAEQYSRYGLIWGTMLAANVLVYEKGLMRVDFLDNFWPKKLLQVRETIYAGLFVIILSVVTWQGWRQAVDYIGIQVMGLPIDKFWIYLSIPVGIALMLLQYLANLLVDFMETGVRTRQESSTADFKEDQKGERP